MTASLHQALLAERIEAARSLRLRFTACLAEVDANGGGADAFATAVVASLAGTATAELPLAAQAIWIDRLVRPLKADPAKPLPARSAATIRSWPSSRIADLRAALGEIEAILSTAETEAMNEAIYAEISRAYS